MRLVKAALIGGLAAFGVPAAIAVPSVLLYRVLTCWLPVFIGCDHALAHQERRDLTARSARRSMW